MFFGLPDLDPLVRILPSSSKNRKKNLDFYCFVTFLWLILSLKKNVNAPVFRIRMFFGLPDPHPDPLVTSTEPAPDPTPQSSSKNTVGRKTLISNVLWTRSRILTNGSETVIASYQLCVCSSVSSEELNSYIPRHRHIEVDLPPGCNTQVMPSILRSYGLAKLLSYSIYRSMCIVYEMLYRGYVRL